MFLLGIFGTPFPYLVGLIVYIIIMLQIGNVPTSNDLTPPLTHCINVTDDRLSHESAKTATCYHYSSERQNDTVEIRLQSITWAKAIIIDFHETTIAFLSHGYSSYKQNKAPPVA